MENKIIYIVTSGSYSDYSIDAVFSTKELAKSFIDKFNHSIWDEMDIEEWEIDLNAEHLKSKRTPYFLRINKEGKISDLKVSTSCTGFKKDLSNPSISFTQDEKWMNIYCYANDADHAKKIAGEKRTQILANNLWGSTLI